MASSVPAHCRTLGDLAKSVVGLNYGKLAKEFGASRDRELIEALRYTIADATGIAPKDLARQDLTLIDLVLANDGLRAQMGR
jgi:hypothetical protein